MQIGDKLYGDSKTALGSNYVHPFLTPYQISKTVDINGKNIIFCIDDEKTKFGNLMEVAEKSDFELIDLEGGLEQIFAEFKYCIFVTGDFAISIMKSNELFWIFDSHERGENGLYVEGGKAVLIEFNGLNDVVGHLRQLYGFRNSQYDIVPIDIVFKGDLSDRPDLNLKGDSQISRPLGGSLEHSKCSNSKARSFILKKNRGGLSDQPGSSKESTNFPRGRLSGKPSDKPGTSKESSDFCRGCPSDNPIDQLGKSKESSELSRGDPSDERNYKPNFMSVVLTSLNSKSGDLQESLDFCREGPSGQPKCSDSISKVVILRKTTSNPLNNSKKGKNLKKAMNFLGQSKQKSLKDESKDVLCNEGSMDFPKEETCSNIQYNTRKYVKKHNKVMRKIMKEKRACDLKYRERDLAYVKERLANDPEYRERNLQNVKERLANDPEYRERNLQNVTFKRKCKSQNDQGRDKLYATFCENIDDGPMHMCACCGQLNFKTNVCEMKTENHTRLLKKKSCKSLNLGEVCIKATTGVCMVCHYCKGYLNRGEVPPLALVNGLEFPSVPEELSGLEEVEKRVISPRITFMQIRELNPHVGGQYGIRGGCVNVPIDINKTVSVLPRNLNECETLMLKVKRRMSDKQSYQGGLIRPAKIFKAAEYFVNTDICKEYSIQLNTEWVNENENLKIPEMECDDAESDENIDDDVESLQDSEHDDLVQEMLDCNDGVDVQNNCDFGEKEQCADGDDLFCDKTKCNFGDISPDCSVCHDVMNVNCDCNKECVVVDDITNELIECNKRPHNPKLEKNVNSGETDCSSDVDDAEILRQCDTLMTKDYLPEGLVQDTCVTVAPGEGEIPKSMLSDSDYDILAYPTVYCGVKRKFKVPLPPCQILKSDLRKYDRRGATNVPWLFTKFAESRLRRLVSRAIFALRKTRKEKNLTVKQLLDPEKLNNLIEHDEAYRILQADRSSPAYWEFRKKLVMGMIRQLLRLYSI